MAATRSEMDQPKGSRSKGNSAARTVASATDRARTFKQARRHSFLVRILKFIFPVVTVGLLGAYGATLMVTNGLKGKKGGFDPGTVKIDPTNLTMENPKYDGFGTDGSHYVVRAKAAISDLRQTGPVKLITIDSDLTQTTGVLTHLKAVWGTYDQKKDLLELYEKVDVDGSTGMKARLTRATILTKESRITSDEPVYVEMDTGNIRAQSMALNTKSRQATFIDQVHVKLKANPPKPEDAAKPKAAAPMMPGLAANSGQPIEVKSQQLDIDDAQKTALFRRDVIARQGEAVLQAPELDVFYEGKADIMGGPAKKPESADPNAEAGSTPAAPAADAQTRLKLIKARGGVQMTNKDDTATGETLDYDATTERAVLKGNVVLTSLNDRRVTAAQADLDQKADTALLTGGVVVIQGKNTMKGRRLFVDRKSGKTRLESPAEPGLGAARIQTVFYQAAKPADPKAAAKTKEATAATDGPAGMFAIKADPNQPIDIEAETLDIADQQKIAIYKGNVVAKQGDFIIKTPLMTAHYTGQAGIATAGAPAAAQPKGTKGDAAKADAGAQLTLVEMRQKVVVHGRDNQQAVGDWADYDVKSNTIVLGGKVTVSQGVGGKENVIQGPEGSRLFIDMTSGVSKFEQTATAVAPAPGSKQVSKPVISASPAATGPGSSTDEATECPPGSICKKGRMRMVLYPKQKDLTVKPGDKAGTMDKSKDAANKDAPNKDAPNKDAGPKAAKTGTASSAWDSTTTPTAGRQ